MNFNNLIYLCLSYFFYVIGDMLVKSMVKFVVSLASLLKKSTNYLKTVIFFKNFGPFTKGDVAFF